MADVLSQGEIDSLLKAVTTGQFNQDKSRPDEKKVKVYDFKRALRYSKDQIRSLTRIHENYARLLTTQFSAQLRMLAQISVISVDQLSYEEFIRSMPEMTILTIFEDDTLEGRMVMEVSPSVAFAMLDRLLGGTGRTTSYDKKLRLTEIDGMVLENLFSRALDLLGDAWKDLTELTPNLLEIETNPQFLQVASPNETVIVVSLNVKIGETTGLMNLCFPHIVLEPVIPKITSHQWLSSRRKSKNEEELTTLRSRVHKVELPLIAELGTATIQVQDFLNLRVGDVIQLDQSTDSQLTIKIGHLAKFLARPGVKKGKMAVQIEQVLEEGVEENE